MSQETIQLVSRGFVSLVISYEGVIHCNYLLETFNSGI
jgi:hypothetical protein